MSLTPAKRLALQLVVGICLFLFFPGWAVVAATTERGESSTIPSPETLAGCGGADFPGSDSGFEREVLRLINGIRMNAGLYPLKLVDLITAAARFHATDMSEENYFSHTSYDRVNGELVESCQWNDRLRTYYSDWNWGSENIAAGFGTPQSVVDGWMNSAGHRNNILSPNNWETGVGFFKGNGSYRNYWVQDFGRRPNVYPVVINGEAETTDDGTLTIHIFGDWDELRMRVDGGEWPAWKPFVSPLSWQLKAAPGVHSVEIEMRSASASASGSDQITLTQNTAEPELNVLPDTLTFFYNPDADNVSPGYYTIQPLAAGGDPNYTWQVVANATWLSVTPGQGSSTENVAIVPSVSGADGSSSNAATITVSLRKNDGTVIAEKQIAVSLAVLDAKFFVFAPVVSRQ